MQVGIEPKQLLDQSWAEQEALLYSTAAYAIQQDKQWFRHQPHMPKPDLFVEYPSENEWWYNWYVVVLRTSLLHNPFHGKKPVLPSPPADAVQVVDYENPSEFD